MRLKYTECCNGGNIFRDFANFNKVSEYLQNLVDIYSHKNSVIKLEMCPIECAYRDIKTGEARWIIQSGHLCDDAQKNINALKRQRRVVDAFISDYLVIAADAFEGECFFSWD